MKKIIYFLTFLLFGFTNAQTGADITGLVKINGIQQSNTNRVLLTDGNGNLGFTTFSNLSNVGTVVTSTLNLGVVKTQINQNAKFRNLPNANSNRIVTIDSNGSLGYRTFNSLSNSGTISGTVGLNATNLINLTNNIFSSPTSYGYLVVVDANGVLGKRLLSDITTVTDPGISCTAWTTTSYGTWGSWYNGGCYADRINTQQRTCYRIDGTPTTQTQNVTETRTDGCAQNTGIACYWTTTSTGNWECDPANVNNKRRIKNESLICTRINGTTYTSATQSVNYEISTGANPAPTADFNWSANYRTITFTPTFTDDGSVTSISWNFGDGSALATQQNPISGATNSYTYNNSNINQAVTKSVTMTVTDNCGRTTSVTKTITTASKVVTKTIIARRSVYIWDISTNNQGDGNFLGDFEFNISGNTLNISDRLGLIDNVGHYDGGNGGNHHVELYDNSSSSIIAQSPTSYNIVVPGGNGYCTQGDIVTASYSFPNIISITDLNTDVTTQAPNNPSGGVFRFIENGVGNQSTYLDECSYNGKYKFAADLDAATLSLFYEKYFQVKLYEY